MRKNASSLAADWLSAGSDLITRMAFRSLRGQRVVLREYQVEDRETIVSWLGEAVASAGFSEPLQPPSGAQLGPSAGDGQPPRGRLLVLVIERVGESGPVGLLEGQLADRCLIVSFIAMAKAFRGWGYGSEAVRKVEEWLINEGLARSFTTEVPARNGLGLYFWLRLGYRPERPGEDSWRWAREPDRMRMVRHANEQR